MSRTVAEIIKDKGAQQIAEALGVPGANVRMWKKRGRIPQEHWRDLAEKRLASLEELAAAAAGSTAP